MGISDLETYITLVESVVTSAAILAAGWWTYFLFVKKRLRYPIIDLSFSLKKFNLDDGKLLIRAVVGVNNIGTILFKSEFAELRLRQVYPLINETKNFIEIGIDPVSNGETQVLWPLLSERDWNWGAEGLEIEPAEKEFLHADFVVSADLEIVELYFYLKNKSKVNKQLGWQLIEILNIKDEVHENV